MYKNIITLLSLSKIDSKMNKIQINFGSWEIEERMLGKGLNWFAKGEAKDNSFI